MPLDQAEQHIAARVATSLVAHCGCDVVPQPRTVGGRTIWRRVHDDTCTLTPPAGGPAPASSPLGDPGLSAAFTYEARGVR